MKVTPSTSLQQINWQKVANDRQERLEDAAKGKIIKEEQFEIYKTKGKRLELESVSLTKRIDIEV